MTTPPIFEIPTIPQPLTEGIQLSGSGYLLRITWCWPVECWMLDILNGTTLVPLLLGHPLVTGADLLEQFAYLGLDGMMIVQSDFDTFAPPTFYNLGTLSHLYFVPLVVS